MAVSGTDALGLLKLKGGKDQSGLLKFQGFALTFRLGFQRRGLET